MAQISHKQNNMKLVSPQKKWNRDYVLNCGLQVCRPLIFQRGWKTCKGVGVDQGLTGLQGGGWLSRISMLGAFSMHLKPSASTMRLFQGHMHQKGKVCLFISESVIAYFIIFLFVSICKWMRWDSLEKKNCENNIGFKCQKSWGNNVN